MQLNNTKIYPKLMGENFIKMSILTQQCTHSCDHYQHFIDIFQINKSNLNVCGVTKDSEKYSDPEKREQAGVISSLTSINIMHLKAPQDVLELAQRQAQRSESSEINLQARHVVSYF